MPAVDLVARVRRLAAIRTTALAALLDPDGDREWGPHEENTARLYELMRWQGGLEWADRTTDPEEARKQAAIAKRNKIKPPDQPLIPPVALRPPGESERRLQAFIEEAAKYQPKAAASSVSRAEFDRAHGLTE
jgi:hypothetical protein